MEQFYWLITFFVLVEDKSYLVTPQNCRKMLRNLTLVVQFAYFSIRLSSIEQLVSNFRYKKQLLIVFLTTFCEITGNFSENRISSILWKALGRTNPSPHPTNKVGRVYPEFFPSFNFV